MNTNEQLRPIRDKIRSIVEVALQDFSESQINLSSQNAREAIALRITSDLISRFELETTNERHRGSF